MSFMATAAAEQRAPVVALPEERAKIRRLELALKELPQLEVTLKHHFCQGVYAREGFIPKGACFVGRVHKQSQINIISKGDISVLTERGLIRMTAPCTLVSPPGAQRAAYAHEDTVWTTILGTDETDPDTIFNTLTVATFEQYELICKEMQQLIGDGPCSFQP